MLPPLARGAVVLQTEAVGKERVRSWAPAATAHSAGSETVRRNSLPRDPQMIGERPLCVAPLRVGVKAGGARHLGNLRRVEFVTALGPDGLAFAEVHFHDPHGRGLG